MTDLNKQGYSRATDFRAGKIADSVPPKPTKSVNVHSCHTVMVTSLKVIETWCKNDGKEKEDICRLSRILRVRIAEKDPCEACPWWKDYHSAKFCGDCGRLLEA